MNTFAKSAFLIGSLAVSLNASSLDFLIENALSSHPSLQAIKQKIQAIDSNIALSRQFSNPKLSLSINDIQLSDIDNRSIEPMQTNMISLEQKLPYFGKRDAKEQSAKENKKVEQLMLEEVKTELVSRIKQSAYRVWEFTTLYTIICKFEELTQQSIDLNTAYSSTKSNQHMGIMSATMSLSELKIKKNRLLQALKSEYAVLSYLSFQKVTDLDLSLKMHKLPNLSNLAQGLVNNFTIKTKKSSIDEAKAILSLKDLEHYPDPTIKAGYFQRSSFEDYVSFTIGTALPLYGSEELKSEKQRKVVLERKNSLANTELKVNSELKANYAQMRQAYITHTILTEESMPQVEHMFDLSTSRITSGGDLFKYIDLIKQELALEEQRVRAIGEYHKYEAKIEALLGVQK